MKKLLLFLLLFTGMVNAQIVNIPDANFKAKLLAADFTNNIAQNFNDDSIKIDINNDGEIQQSEALIVKRLYLNNSSLISDITGLNSFSNLEILLFHQPNVTVLNLNSLLNLKTLGIYYSEILTTIQIEALTNLEGIQINGLPLLTNLILNSSVNLKVFDSSFVPLTSLDLSGHSNLTSLYCQFNNLINLNINDCINLTELNCVGNKLTNLNGLSPSLTKLFCSSNLLTNLNLNSLLNLTELQCSQNKLTNLTINGLTSLQNLNCSGNKLTDLNVNLLNSLITLDCGDNKLTNLTITNLANLSQLICNTNELDDLILNNLPNLNQLDCRYTKIVNLALNGLTSLTTLDCSFNYLLSTVTLTNLTSLQNFSIIGASTSYDSNQSILSNLDLSGLPNLKILNCYYNKLTSLNLNNLTNLTDLNCGGNLLTSLDISNLTNLKRLSCNYNPMSILNANNMLNLEEIVCGGFWQNNQLFPQLNSLNLTGSINLKKINCESTLLPTIDLNGLVNLEELIITGQSQIAGSVTSLNVSGLLNLKKLNCTNQSLTNLDVSNLTNLVELDCSYNQITNLNLVGLPNLQILNYQYNQLASLNLINLPSLLSLNCGYNQLITLNVINLTSLKRLDCYHNNLTTLNLTGLSALEYLNFSENQISISNISGLSTNLKELFCDSNELTSLNVSNLTNLETLSCRNNQLNSIDLSTLNNLKIFSITTNLLSTIDVSNLTQLESLDVSVNQLTSLNLIGLITLKFLNYRLNIIPNLDISFLTNLEQLDCSDTQSTILNVNALTKLTILNCTNNQLTTLDVSALNKLLFFACNNNQLTTLNVSSCSTLDVLACENNQLTTLFIKNGSNENIQNNLYFSNNPNLQYICADDMQLESIQTQLNALGMNTTVSNSYCSFTPGGNNNTASGITIYDVNNNGCDVTDEVNPFIRLNINDGATNGATVTNSNGTYNFFTNAGVYTITPNVENPSWFDFSPSSATITFLDNNNNVNTQNFCIAPVGLHPDIEVVLMPIEVARPGFNATYKIVFKNKGNQMQSGAVNFVFDDTRLDFISANPVISSAVTNNLSWNYENLMPFENRSIEFTLNVNSPQETPAVNNGDIFNFSTSITPVIGDDLPNDNSFTFNQIVVGSFDPNDITCLEGDTVDPTDIGDYLHYVINFENLGTFYAENVVVRDEIDTTKYDISTLQVMNTSHPSYTRITGNVVEFIFENINLAAAQGNPPVGGHGNVLFKIKSKETLSAGDSVNKSAAIFFDYNAPVLTNDATTTFISLSNTIFEFDKSISVYPNPTTSTININCNNKIKSIEIYDVQGRIIETLLGNTKSIDVSSKQNGIYFLKITTETGGKVEKIIKE